MSNCGFLFKKPIIFLTSDYYQKYHHHSHVLTIELSKALGTQLIHIGKNFDKNSSVIKKIKQAKINTLKYEEYEKNIFSLIQRYMAVGRIF